VTERQFLDTDRVVATQGLLTTRVDGEVMAMSVERGACYGLDPIGSRVWELVETPISIADLVDRLTREYDVEAEVCRSDVCALLVQLQAEGMIQRL
jgi:hypothetical protein